MKKSRQLPKEWLECEFIPEGESFETLLPHMQKICDDIRGIFAENESPLENHAEAVSALFQAEKKLRELIEQPTKNGDLMQHLSDIAIFKLGNSAERNNILRRRSMIIKNIVNKCIESYKSILAALPPDYLSDDVENQS